jgi:hypothetical protein
VQKPLPCNLQVVLKYSSCASPLGMPSQNVQTPKRPSCATGLELCTELELRSSQKERDWKIC